MPSKSEKQRKFFGAVMGAKKGKGKVKGAAKKVAKEMPEKEIKKFLKKESYDDVINSYLKKYLIEMDVRQDPREGFDGDPFIDPTENIGGEEVSRDEMYKVVADAMGEQKASMMSDEEVREAYYYIQKDPSMGQDEDYEEECESAEQGCSCNECPACQANQNKKSDILTFYGLQ